MQDDLQKAYSAYQQALYLLPNPKACRLFLTKPQHVTCVAAQEDPKLWYGIGILYDRYGSLDHAEEAFASVLKMDKGWSLFLFALARLCTHLAELDFDKANEILFRLGIIYKQQGKYEESLSCFDRILRNPPSPLAHADIWFQIGHVFEQQKDVSPHLPPSRLCDGYRSPPSMSALKMHTNESSLTILDTPKCFNNLAGCIIRMVHPSRIRSSLYNISPRVSKLVSCYLRIVDSIHRSLQTRRTPKAGISSVVLTWLGKSTTRHTKHINRLSIAMDATRHSGAPLEYSTSRSISSVMLWMHIRAPSESTLTSPRSGLILAVSTRAATIRSRMPSTPMPGLVNSILAIM